ncbi:hypothetical protein J5N97_000915 [Dioscorea zingiberensis]|uniref:Retrotransposon gag domain-containing protein n=1 Tax=Dioscorea zingiberensis TaxID=325984 RepID=A0A9D5BV19_9LILI|nr:hypothetical protein J5N97_000915 [Dioscorea zingiberensis]
MTYRSRERYRSLDLHPSPRGRSPYRFHSRRQSPRRDSPYRRYSPSWRYMTERERVQQLVPHVSSPFIKAIWEAPFPDHFRPPNVSSYDGTSDPQEHLESYRDEMMVNRTTEAVMCRAFPRTLSGDAHDWFRGIPPGTIHNFQQLSDLFLCNFASNRKMKKNPMMLLGSGRDRRKLFADTLAVSIRTSTAWWI